MIKSGRRLVKFEINVLLESHKLLGFISNIIGTPGGSIPPRVRVPGVRVSVQTEAMVASCNKLL